MPVHLIQSMVVVDAPVVGTIPGFRAFRAFRAFRHPPPSPRAPEAAVSAPKAMSKGHSALLHGLGDVGLIPAQMMPLILRIAHVVGKGAVNVPGSEEGSGLGGEDGSQKLEEEVEKKTAFGILCWKVALEYGLVPDDKTLRHLQRVEKLAFLQGRDLDDPSLRWPMEPLRSVLIKEVSVLGIASLAAKYPVIQDTLLKGILTTVFEFAKHVYKIEEFVEEREKDEDGNVYENTEEIGQRQESMQGKYRNPNMTPEQAEIARKKRLAEMKMKQENAFMDLRSFLRVAASRWMGASGTERGGRRWTS